MLNYILLNTLTNKLSVQEQHANWKQIKHISGDTYYVRTQNNFTYIYNSSSKADAVELMEKISSYNNPKLTKT